MGNGITPSQTAWLGFVRALKWLIRAVTLAVALYVFFPPLWDAAFAGNLDALHKAPYIAADRARHLWHRIVDNLDERGRRNSGLGVDTTNRHH